MQKQTRSKKQDICIKYNDLIDHVVDISGYHRYEVNDVLEAFTLGLFKLLVEQDKPVEVKYLGRFKKNLRKARLLKSNLSKFNNELVVELPAKYTCSFAPSRTFKQQMNTRVQELEQEKKKEKNATTKEVS